VTDLDNDKKKEVLVVKNIDTSGGAFSRVRINRPALARLLDGMPDTGKIRSGPGIDLDVACRPEVRRGGQ